MMLYLQLVQEEKLTKTAPFLMVCATHQTAHVVQHTLSNLHTIGL